MGRGGALCPSSTTLVLLSIVSTAHACLWCVQIDESPAPPPDKVPPFSANAVRDISFLPYQIVGVLGAYVGTVLIIGSLILTVGRKMRHRAQEQPTPQQEMIKPMYRQFDPSPVSPASGRWNRLRGKRSEASSIRSMGSGAGMSPEAVMGGFDNTVLEADRARMQSEMERLYAAVMQQDTNKGQPVSTVVPMSPPPEPPAYASAGPNGDRHWGQHLQPGQTYQQSPRSPVRAIYPPASRTLSGDTLQAAGEHSRTNSLASSRSIKSSSSKRARKSLRNLTISAPLQHHRGADDDDLRTPLSPRSPRIYIDPGIPPEPQTPHDPFNPPETPATERVFSLYSDEQDDYDEGEQLDEIRDLPQATPQRPADVSRPRIITNFSKPVLSPTTATAPPLRATGSGTLPLREMNRQYAAQVQSSQAPYSQSANQWSNPRSPGQTGATGGYVTSAGPVKTTFVEARRDRLGVGGHGLRTPLTGMATPYSPYMPFTPMTPVTPHLTTRAERRQRAREDRTIMGAVTEEDAVADERELWDSGY